MHPWTLPLAAALGLLALLASDVGSGLGAALVAAGALGVAAGFGRLRPTT